MRISRFSLLVIAALVWYTGGIILLLKGGSLLKSALVLDSQHWGAYVAAVIGPTAGLIKTKYIFNNVSRKNILRIRALTDPRPWQFFRAGFFIFLALMIFAGASMSRLADGNYTALCLVGALDLSISTALLSSSFMFWKLKAFSFADG